MLGLKGIVTIYRNFSDVGTNFAGALIPIVAVASSSLFHGLVQDIFVFLIVIVEIVIYSYIIVQTYIDNRSILKTLIALITKIPISILYIFNLLQLSSPSGRGGGERQSNRMRALGFLLILSLLVYGLVKEK